MTLSRDDEASFKKKKEQTTLLDLDHIDTFLIFFLVGSFSRNLSRPS